MSKYKIVGVEHKEGTSRQGRPYNMDVLHVVSAAESRKEGFQGYATDQIPIGRDSGILVQIPRPGEMWEINFNRQGYVEDAYICK